MLKKALTALSCAASALLLSSCGTINTSDINSPGLKNAPVKATAAQCTSTLTQAYQRYNNLKNTSDKQASFFDWGKLNDLIAGAAVAHQAGKNGVCVQNAKDAINYIQRDENYLAWKKSLTA